MYFSPIKSLKVTQKGKTPHTKQKLITKRNCETQITKYQQFNSRLLHIADLILKICKYHNQVHRTSFTHPARKA